MTMTLVRNTMPGPTVFTLPTTNETVEWEGANDPNGADIQPIPAHMLENVQFQKNLTKGIFQVETDDSLRERVAAQHKAEWDSRIAAQKDAGQQSMDLAPNNDQVIRTCLGPSGKGPNLACGADVPIKMSELAEKPPLCSFHKDLANQFVSTQTDNMVGGQPEIVWKKVVIDPRQPSPSQS